VLALQLSYAMRGPYVARWLRIHSLPESTRYPEGPGEYALGPGWRPPRPTPNVAFQSSP
jgi:hypothetical protein